MNNAQINNQTKNMRDFAQNNNNNNGKTMPNGTDTAMSFSLVEILNEKIIRSKELTDVTKKQNKNIKMSDLTVGTVDPKKFNLKGRGSFC